MKLVYFLIKLLLLATFVCTLALGIMAFILGAGFCFIRDCFLIGMKAYEEAGKFFFSER